MNTDQRLLQAIAKLYYEEGRTQSEIATQFSISRPKVSRKLAEARERGIVKIFIDDAIDDISEMEQQLLTAFHLKGARVASVPEDDVELAIQLTARLGAQFLPTFLDPGDHIGVNWGWTLFELSKEFPAFSLPDCSLVQLSGAVDNANCRSFAHEIISNLSQKLGAESAFCLPCPALVESPIILDILLHDAKVRSLLERVEDCNKLFVNIATPDEDSCLYQAGYLNDENIARLKDVEAVGSICSRFFDKNGNICDPELDKRTVGISLDAIKNAECVLACIVGRQKARAVYYALKAGWIDVLVTDSLTAERVIDLAKREGVL